MRMLKINFIQESDADGSAYPLSPKSTGGRSVSSRSPTPSRKTMVGSRVHTWWWLMWSLILKWLRCFDLCNQTYWTGQAYSWSQLTIVHAAWPWIFRTAESICVMQDCPNGI